MLRATTARTFSTSQLPKVVRRWCVLYILTSKCASRHNGVHFFDIATSKSGPKLVCFVHFDLEMCFAPQRRAIFHLHLASWLRTRRFSEPTFRPSGATNHWKNTMFRDFPTFSRICIFFLLTLLSSNLSLLSASSLLCFSSVHIVGSLTSKLPSTIHYNTLPYITIHYNTLQYITIHYNTLQYITIQYITIHYNTLQYITIHYNTLQYITIHYNTLQYITIHYNTYIHTYTHIYIHNYLHCITLHYITLHHITLHYTTLHYITIHYITLHYIHTYILTLHYITLHYTTLHYIHTYTYTYTYAYTLYTYVYIYILIHDTGNRL